MTMTKATYNKVSFDFRFKRVRVCDRPGGAWQKAGRQGTGTAVAERLHCDLQGGGREKRGSE